MATEGDKREGRGSCHVCGLSTVRSNLIHHKKSIGQTARQIERQLERQTVRQEYRARLR